MYWTIRLFSFGEEKGKPKLPWSNVRGSLNQSDAGSAAGSLITMVTEQESSGFTLLLRVRVQYIPNYNCL